MHSTDTEINVNTNLEKSEKQIIMIVEQFGIIVTENGK